MRSPNEPSTGRRDFLNSFTVGVFAVMGLGRLSPPRNNMWDERWAKNLRGKRKIIFDATQVAQGTVLTQVELAITSYRDFLGVPSNRLGIVILLRHRAIPIALNDSAWSEHALGVTLGLKDPSSGGPAKRNPFFQLRTTDAFAGIDAQASIARLLKHGVVFLVCDRAVRALSIALEQQTRANFNVVYRGLRSSLIPGMTLVPNGIVALARAQEEGCAYIPVGATS
jgi:intracellular sulfur oxidation DsrE/DsrF family protein